MSDSPNKYRLREEWRGTRWPSGGFPFVDPRTGMYFDRNHGDIRDKIAMVQKHRIANPHVYPPGDGHLDANSIRDEIEKYMCEQKPQLCGDGPVMPAYTPMINVIITPTVACSKCGKTDWKAMFCQSCSGNRITGWECKSCGGKI